MTDYVMEHWNKWENRTWHTLHRFGTVTCTVKGCRGLPCFPIPHSSSLGVKYWVSLVWNAAAQNVRRGPRPFLSLTLSAAPVEESRGRGGVGGGPQSHVPATRVCLSTREPRVLSAVPWFQKASVYNSFFS